MVIEWRSRKPNMRVRISLETMNFSLYSAVSDEKLVFHISEDGSEIEVSNSILIIQSKMPQILIFAHKPYTNTTES